MMQPKVSIIIPTYNRSEDLKRAINSVIRQTYTNWELIIVDNYSVDETDQVVKSYLDPRIFLFKVKNEGVIAVSRNLGITKSSGEYIAFLDSDDWWKPNKLALSVLALNSGADIVYHDLVRVQKSNQKWNFKKLKTRKLGINQFDDLLEYGNAILNSSVVLKKELIFKVGMLNQDRKFIAWEDFDFWLRIAKGNFKFKRLSECLGFYWQVGGNLSNDKRSLEIFKAILETYSLDLRDGKTPPWIHFERAKIQSRSRDYESAIQNLKLIEIRNLRFYLKGSILKLLIFLKIFLKK